MPTSRAQQFAEDTAFEQSALQRGVPLIQPKLGSSTLDLRGEHLSLSATVRPATAHAVVVMDGFDGGPQLLDVLRPLLFGAAWKILDLLVEWALEDAGVPLPTGLRTYPISFKVNQCRTQLAAMAPFDRHPDVWAGLTTCYAGTEQLRHSLVHRQAIVDGGGSFTATDGARNPVGPPLTPAEQDAFCRAAQRAADAAIDGSMDQRIRGDLAFNLDLLVAHHTGGSIGGIEAPGRITIVQVSPDETGSLDLPAVNAAARQHVPAPFYDLEVHLPDGRVMVGRLENAPNDRITIDPASPPAWLSWS